jgi:hypothetical protein
MLRALFVATCFIPGATAAAEWQCDAGVPVHVEAGKPDDDRAELSGVVTAADGHGFLAISNEALKSKGRWYGVQDYAGDPDNGYRLKRDVELFEADEGACAQADFEGLSRHGEEYFAVTSHSANREKQDEGDSRDANARRLTRAGISTCDSRDQLIKFKLGDGEKAEVEQRTSLRDYINASPVLSPFAGIPNKENGVDIEGIAATDEDLFIGFRGPVLRENFVPVLRLSQDLTHDKVADGKMLFVNLEGRAIRDLAPAPDDGLYVLAGPNGDEPQTYAIFAWDGRSQVAGKGEPAGKAKRLCELGLHPKDQEFKSKPEGFTVLEHSKDKLRFLIVFDGKKQPLAEIRTLTRR